MSLKSRIGEATLRVSPPQAAVDDRAALEIPRMIELMELAAIRLMRPHLALGQTSVSIETKVTHAAPTTVGGTLRAVAAYDGASGRTHRFTVNVFDESGLIGIAKHSRAVVAEGSVVSLARRRPGKAGVQVAV